VSYPLNITSEWLVGFSGVAYSVAVDSYAAILEILVTEFKLYTTNEYLMKKIRCNIDLGFTSGLEAGEAVMRRHGLWGLFAPAKPPDNQIFKMPTFSSGFVVQHESMISICKYRKQPL
jgi:hypothetical protein